MTGAEFIAGFLATGSLLGLRPGAAPADVDRALKVGFMEERDGPGGSLRRDYGLLELYFTAGPHRLLTSGVLELHRLPCAPEMAAEWRSATGVDFAPYTAWSEVAEALPPSGQPAVLALEGTDPDDHLEYRNPADKVSVLVVGAEGERSDWPGHGDVWSVSFG
ncbi:hypothetical protein OG625_19730 [Streptomyces sp. NBC_01351]|uniref:hypothetical protein n=1 Tax=Streptomyces sp. NBC_01351 TaxID=2903833 RepID=UPI002E31F2E8|nr:hypothetical protein [Streptomyces sp. NBC_01351]